MGGNQDTELRPVRVLKVEYYLADLFAFLIAETQDRIIAGCQGKAQVVSGPSQGCISPGDHRG